MASLTSVGQTTKRLVTGIAYKDTRDINPNIIDVANETGFDDLMMLIEGYKPTEQPIYIHFENEDLFQVLVFTAVAGSGTPTLTVTVSTTGYARRGLKFKFANKKEGFINSAITTSAGADSFTIVSVDGTNLTAVTTDKIASMGIVMGEGSDQVTALSYEQDSYFNLVEHMKDMTQITDIQEASKIETGTGYEAFLQAINQAQSFKTDISWTLFAGVKSVNQYGSATSTLNDQYGGPVQTTGGLDGEADAYGVDADVATPGTYLLSDVDNLCDALVAVKAQSQYLQLCPDSAKRKASTMWKNMGSAGVTSSRLVWNGNEKDFNVDQVTYGKFELNYGKLDLLDHPQKASFAGASNIGKTIYGIPKEKVKVQAGPGGKGGTANRIQVRYLPNKWAAKNQGTEYVREWYTGANTENPTSGLEVRTCHISTTQGFEASGFRQVFHQQVLA